MSQNTVAKSPSKTISKDFDLSDENEEIGCDIHLGRSMHRDEPKYIDNS